MDLFITSATSYTNLKFATTSHKTAELFNAMDMFLLKSSHELVNID